MNDTIEQSQNTARFFVEHRQVSAVLLLFVLAWGVYGYNHMPKRKDPDIPVRVATAVTPWPGQTAVEIEQLVTRQVEETVAQSSGIEMPSATGFGIKSLTLPNLSIVQVQLAEGILDTEKVFNDINLRLDALAPNLPEGAGPVRWNSGFGDTAAVLLTVASPVEDAISLELRAQSLRSAIVGVRADAPTGERRVTLVVPLPQSVDPAVAGRVLDDLSRILRDASLGRDFTRITDSGFAALDCATGTDTQLLLTAASELAAGKLGLPRFHPDAWDPVIIVDPAETLERLTSVAGDKYTYHELDQFTDLLSRTIETIPQVSKIERSGVLDQRVYMDYSQEQLAAYGIRPALIPEIIKGRNTVIPGGFIEADDTSVLVSPAGQFTSAAEIGDVILTRARDGSPVYMRSLFDIRRGYQSPPGVLDYLTSRNDDGTWQRNRAISLAVQMRSGEQIGQLASELERVLADVRLRLPDDLLIVRTSDQPRQVKENVDLFMEALIEAIALVVLVGLIGFREWRAALLLMIAIPITLAMTFGMTYAIGIEIQQVSIATLIIALGLLVDDPVVASDAIKRELAIGKPPVLAAWLGPTLLAKAILFATITNIVAYLPFLMLQGTSGQFVRSLPIVMACALIASRIASMTFIPFIGYYLLRAPRRAEPSIEDRRKQGFTGFYYRVAGFAIDHRGKVLLASLLLLAGGAFAKRQLKNQFFPLDVQYLSYVDVTLSNDASIDATEAVVRQAEQVIRDVCAEYARSTRGDHPAREVLDLLYSTIGAGAPRWWYTITPKLNQPNYAQIVVRTTDKKDTPSLAPLLQEALTSRVPGADIDVHQLQLNAVDYPVAVRISGRATVDHKGELADIRTLRELAGGLRKIMAASPFAARVRDDWGEETFLLRLDVDADRADLAGITNADIAAASASGMSGSQVGLLREGDKQIPILARLRLDQRAQLSDLKDLYVYSTKEDNKVPLLEVATIGREMSSPRIRRLEQFRTITVFAFPKSGKLASDVFESLSDEFEDFRASLPPGFTMEITGEQAHQIQGFKHLLTVMGISAIGIYLALVFQFNSAVKPMIVFAAVPYGMVGGIVGLLVMDAPFAFMAFLGLISLIGVIVSHVIVLFDFIETMHDRGEPLREALLDAGIVRLRPVLITVGATVLALFPLAIHGGPLWQPLCYAQIGGLTFATFVTLILVPVLYSTVVLDLKLVKWQGPHRADAT